MARILPPGPAKSELKKLGLIYHRLAKQDANTNIAFLDDVREARNMGLGMGHLVMGTDKIVGKTKEVIAEVIGDQKLQDEGKRQKKNEKPDKHGPVERLNKLT